MVDMFAWNLPRLYSPNGENPPMNRGRVRMKLWRWLDLCIGRTSPKMHAVIRFYAQ